MKLSKIYNIDAKRLPLVERFLLLEDLNKTNKPANDTGFEEE